MRGLPFTATHEDIKQFFEGFQLAEGGDNPVLTFLRFVMIFTYRNVF